MRLVDDGPRRQYAEVFRALGAQLDDGAARDVLLLEAAQGFLIQATTSEGHSSSPAGMSAQRSERLVDDRAIEEAVEAGYARRGTGRQGRAIERPLRILGAYVDLHRSSEVLVLQQGDGWLLRHLVDEGRPTFVVQEFRGPDLEEMRVIAAGSRRPPDAPRRRLFGR